MNLAQFSQITVHNLKADGLDKLYKAKVWQYKQDEQVTQTNYILTSVLPRKRAINGNLGERRCIGKTAIAAPADLGGDQQLRPRQHDGVWQEGDPGLVHLRRPPVHVPEGAAPGAPTTKLGTPLEYVSHQD